MFRKSNKLISQYCLICSHQLFVFTKVINKIVYRCNYCGFGQTKNSKSQKANYHRDQDYIEEEFLFRNIFGRRVRIISHHLQKGKVLEVGCSTGLMLSMLEELGFEVEGVEPSRKAALVAKQRGIKIQNIFFENIKFKRQYNLIIFNHTLEHLENLFDVLAKTSELLQKEGYLFIDLPNFESISAKTLKNKWPQLLPEEHLWHFTESSLKTLLSRFGFKIIYINKSSGIWDLENPLAEFIYSLIHLKKRFFKEVLTAIPALVVSKLNKGADLLVIARKV